MTSGEPGGVFAPLGSLLEMADMHAAGSGLTREEAVADLVVAGIYRLYGAAGFPVSEANPGGYDATELASSLAAESWPAPVRTVELAVPSPEPPGSDELDRLRTQQQQRMREGPEPADPCGACDVPTGDASWAGMARASREACSMLGWPVIIRCLPGEPQECGHGFADHTLAHLATLIAVAEHQLIHLGADEPDRAHIVSLISSSVHADLARRDAG